MWFYSYLAWMEHFQGTHTEQMIANGNYCRICSTRFELPHQAFTHYHNKHMNVIYRCVECFRECHDIAMLHVCEVCEECKQLNCGCMTESEIEEYYRNWDRFQDPDGDWFYNINP